MADVLTKLIAWVKRPSPMAQDLAALREREKTDPTRCENCLYWQRHSNFGACRRYPPHGSTWPQVLPSGWCGEHRRTGANHG